ncbi:winged helix-turn-helix transcriptional regulator [Micromonospora sp. Llam7]|nr:winged helix-turn-helix transcriptional regulator [Micromonospora tarapacensis]
MTEAHPEPPRVTISDPRTLRALVHPARLAIMEHLASTEGAVTATECAEAAGLSPSATSYHLRALARFGLVAEAPSRGDARERPAAGRSPRWGRRCRGGDVRLPARRPAAGGDRAAPVDRRLRGGRAAGAARLRRARPAGRPGRVRPRPPDAGGCGVGAGCGVGHFGGGPLSRPGTAGLRSGHGRSRRPPPRGAHPVPQLFADLLGADALRRPARRRPAQGLAGPAQRPTGRR